MELQPAQLPSARPSRSLRRRTRRGSTFLEYMLLSAMFCLIILLAVDYMGTVTESMYMYLRDTIENAI